MYTFHQISSEFGAPSLRESRAVARQITQWREKRAAQTLTAWRQLLPLGRALRYAKRVTLFWQGDEPGEILLLERGLVKLVCTSPSGKESLLCLRYPGQFLAPCVRDLGLPYPFSGVTVTTCEIHRIDFARLRAAEQHDARLNEREREAAAQDIYDLAAANLDLKNLSPVERLWCFLCDLATVLGEPYSAAAKPFVLPLDNTEMAELLGVSVSHYKQVRRQLEADGWFIREGRRIRILRLDQQFSIHMRR